MKIKKIITALILILCVISTFMYAFATSEKIVNIDLGGADLGGAKTLSVVLANYKKDILTDTKVLSYSDLTKIDKSINVNTDCDKTKVFLYAQKEKIIPLKAYTVTSYIGSENEAVKESVNLFLIGDSICVEYAGEKHYPQQGWGAKIGNLFENVNVVNCAKAGYSTATYLVYDRFAKASKYGTGFAWDSDKVFIDEAGNTREVTPVLPQIKKGDFVLVSIGINDGYDINRQKDELGQTTAETYKKHLQKFIDDTRSKGAEIVFATPTTNGRKTGDVYKENYSGRASLMKEVAEKNNVVCLELGKEMANRYNTMSDEDVKKNHMVYDIVKDQLKILESEHNNSNVKQQKDDTTHLTETGANFVADVICDLLRSSNSKLKDYLKD